MNISIQSGASLTFTPANWNTWQTITLAAAQDADTADGSAAIALSSSGCVGATVIATEADDDTTVLIVLTVRALSPGVRIISSVAEPENVKIVRSGGADEIVSPSRVGGYLMADAVRTQGTIDFVSELLSYRGQCQLVERAARAEGSATLRE